MKRTQRVGCNQFSKQGALKRKKKKKKQKKKMKQIMEGESGSLKKITLSGQEMQTDSI